MAENVLYYGDNSTCCTATSRTSRWISFYLDPPFNSDQTYNVLFAARDGTDAAAQIKAFGDTWHWDQAAAKAYEGNGRGWRAGLGGAAGVPRVPRHQ